MDDGSRWSWLARMFSRRSCPVRPGGRDTGVRARHLVPLMGFIVPTAIIGFGFVIPGSCIAGLNELSVGFATTLAGACVTYVLGLRLALRR
jgi:hypothetical protein